MQGSQHVALVQFKQMEVFFMTFGVILEQDMMYRIEKKRLNDY